MEKILVKFVVVSYVELFCNAYKDTDKCKHRHN
jgi:hypothetical protein